MNHKYLEIFTTFPDKHILPKTESNEFLSWAKSDLKGSDKRSRGNAINNIKKALHSKIDEIIANTHVRFCYDWDPYCNIETKLKIVKKIGIKYRRIIEPITEIRNIYEHKYQVPTLKQVRFFYEVATLWLKEINTNFNFVPIAIINLPVKERQIRISGENEDIGKLTFYERKEVIYLDNMRKILFKFYKNGKVEKNPYNEFKWLDLLNIESHAIKNIYSNYMPLSEETINIIIIKYVSWLNEQL